MNIFEKFTPVWLPFLIEEIDEFPGVPVLTLGEPLLGIIVKEGASRKVRQYWGYKSTWQQGEKDDFQYLPADMNTLMRKVFPYPHQPSLQKKFYRKYLSEFNQFTRRNIRSTSLIDTSIGYHKDLLYTLINNPFLPFAGQALKELPRIGGVYRIVESLGVEYKTLYVGQTKDLRKRIYRNHYHGPTRRSTFRRKLLTIGDCEGDKDIQKFLADKCFVQCLEIEGVTERNRFEHFAIAVLEPVYND